MKKKANPVRPKSSKRQQLNTMMEALVLVIARRQMDRRWGTGDRAVLTSGV